MHTNTPPPRLFLANLLGCAMVLFLVCSALGPRLATLLQQATGPWPQGVPALWLILTSMFPPCLLMAHFSAGGRFPLPVGKSRFPLSILLPLFLGATVLINLLNTLILMIGQSLLRFGPAPPANLPHTAQGWLLTLLSACVVGPLLEEWFFRGYVQGVLRRCGVRHAVLLTSLLFTLMHSNLREVLPVFLLSLLLCHATEISGSLRASVLLHGCNNLMALLSQLLRSIDGPWALLLQLLLGIGPVVAALFALRAATRQKRLAALWHPARNTPAKTAPAPQKIPFFWAGAAALAASWVMRIVA